MEENNVQSTMSLKLKLLVNKNTGEIICGEAGKDFVDLIFSFMLLPIGSVMKLFSEVQRSKAAGSALNLYKSIDKLPNVLMNGDKSVLVNPQVLSSFSSTTLRIDEGESIEHGHICYICTNNHNSFYSCGKNTTVHNISKQSGEKCACGYSMSRTVQFRQNNQAETVGSSGGGYVKETVTFIITDDLKVTPTSTIEIIMLLNRLNINDLSQLGDRTVRVGRNEAVELLFASLISTTALNDVFGVKVSSSVQRKRN